MSESEERSTWPPATFSLLGRPVAELLDARTRRRTAELGREPVLAVVTAAADDAAAGYTRSLIRRANSAGVRGLVVQASTEDLLETVRLTSERSDVDALVVPMPLPEGVGALEVAVAVDPAKDVDGAHPRNVGLVALGRGGFAPATAEAVIEILSFYGIDLVGRHVVVVGRSAVVGRPLMQLLVHSDATVTLCHSRTAGLATVTSQADVVVAAIGRPHLITRDHVRAGAVVVDVGTSVGPDGSISGDVDPAAGNGHAASMTPVPGGVGPVTTAVLLSHTLDAAERALQR